MLDPFPPGQAVPLVALRQAARAGIHYDRWSHPAMLADAVLATVQRRDPVTYAWVHYEAARQSIEPLALVDRWVESLKSQIPRRPGVRQRAGW